MSANACSMLDNAPSSLELEYARPSHESSPHTASQQRANDTAKRDGAVTTHYCAATPVAAITTNYKTIYEPQKQQPARRHNDRAH